MSVVGAAVRRTAVHSGHPSAASADPFPHDVGLPETVIIDTCAVIDLLVDPGENGRAVAERLRGRDLAAPDLMFAEAANVLRKLHGRGKLSDAEASMAYAELLELPIEPWPFEAVEQRVWDLRGSMSGFDATFVALSELLTAPLVTTDKRLARAMESLPAVKRRGLEAVEN
ncbi:type II toxin-antitoxin system VapC family toxin [Leifsonia sp. EB34]|uniref:type II toxin-antitoxin system VapC family toxin n=1 Tax=Leifsonia sp. EB34 TaxID=3156303 RepID=UPI0035128FB4